MRRTYFTKRGRYYESLISLDTCLKVSCDRESVCSAGCFTAISRPGRQGSFKRRQKDSHSYGNVPTGGLARARVIPERMPRTVGKGALEGAPLLLSEQHVLVRRRTEVLSYEFQLAEAEAEVSSHEDVLALDRQCNHRISPCKSRAIVACTPQSWYNEVSRKDVQSVEGRSTSLPLYQSPSTPRSWAFFVRKGIRDRRLNPCSHLQNTPVS